MCSVRRVHYDLDGRAARNFAMEEIKCLSLRDSRDVIFSVMTCEYCNPDYGKCISHHIVTQIGEKFDNILFNCSTNAPLYPASMVLVTGPL